MSPPGVIAYIGLGSNLDDPASQLRRAFAELAELPGTQLDATSSLYTSRPLGPSAQPDYINAVARLTTGLPPLVLLDALQQIEHDHQRLPTERWGPRTLDLDLLLYADQRLDLDRLTVPHPEMHRRDFVLRPLLEIAPGLVIPGHGGLRHLLSVSDDLGTRPL